ncbi:Ni/Co efflux regulator RcnB [Chelatococcus caeni]|uniref:Ni/Co efflux regulator RcnB n=2 Tax=Chelatococcus TaxID=28209 RepID=A0A840BSD3_9HYPH|nr:RcnB family protein [Chelatococcus caeni]MBB4015920.1 Ni/Co efflux regulator RcnB [Chelatococcus caeni]
MKKIALVVASAAVLVSGAAFAQPYPSHRGPDVRIEHRDVRTERRDVRIERHDRHPRHVEPQHRPGRPHWAKGQRFEWKKHRHREIHARDYRRYRLQEPPRGHRWVEVDGRFMMVNVATGIIASIFMMH